MIRQSVAAALCFACALGLAACSKNSEAPAEIANRSIPPSALDDALAAGGAASSAGDPAAARPPKAEARAPTPSSAASATDGP